MDFSQPDAEGTFELTATLVDDHHSTLSIEGELPGYGKTWGTYTLQVGSESRVAGTLTGNGRTLNNEGVMLSAVISGVWKRENTVLHLTTLDQVNTGDQALVRCEINIITKQVSVKIFHLD